ncbi:MAG: cytochrome P450, partial [Halieaceae bacterium]|nr:cytochrome P450 [Halieaceae bacterium]
MQSISESVLVDSGQRLPTYPQRYPSLDGFMLADPSSWTKGQPFDHFKQMRERAPVMWSEPSRKQQQLNGFWSVTRYDDIKQVELAPDVFSSQRGSMLLALGPREEWKPRQLIDASVNSLINLDAPLHTSLRTQQSSFFFPAYVETLKARVREKVDQLLDNMETQGPVVDFAKLFSTELPLFTLCEMLGIDEADRPKVVKWMHYLEAASQYLTNPFRAFLAEPTLPLRFNAVLREMFAYGAAVMADRRKNPREDLLTTIAHAELDGEPLSQDFLDGSWLLIIFAGNDTTRNSLSGTMRLMTEFPEQRKRILDDPSLIPRMSQEALRMVSPVMHMRRTATEDTEINGQKIAKDEKLIMWYGAGNRDPEVFPNPDVFDLDRPNVDKHIAFGHGVHKCLGSRIAQMQLSIAYE